MDDNSFLLLPGGGPSLCSTESMQASGHSLGTRNPRLTCRGARDKQVRKGRGTEEEKKSGGILGGNRGSDEQFLF